MASISRLITLCLALLLTLVFAYTTPAVAALSINGNGTVTDTTTGLVWDQCSYGLTGAACDGGALLESDWPTALTTAVSANAVNYKGFNDWRMPNVKELQSIQNFEASNPVIDSIAFPATASVPYWSSSVSALDRTLWWVVDFGLGAVYADRGSTYKVRLVRSGHALAVFDLLRALPTLSGLGVSGTTSSATTLAGTSSAAGTGYWIAVPSGSVAPTAAQVKAGVDYGAVNLAAAGNAAMLATVAKTFNVSGLAPGTAYALYVVVEDASPALSTLGGPVTFTTIQIAQALTFGTAPSMTFGGANATVIATSASPNSGNPITYSVPSTTSVCSVNSSSGSVTALSAGTCTVAANQAGNTTYSAAPQVMQNISIGLGSQGSFAVVASPSSISFNTTSALSTTGGSGVGTVTYAITTGASFCSISATTLTGTSVGTCTVTASKAADANFTAATATVNVSVTQAAQAITSFTAPASLVVGAGTGSLAATGGASGNAVTFTSTTTAVCTVSGSNGNTLTAVAAGTCTVAADQAGNTNYSAAPQVTKTITVDAAPVRTSTGSAPTGSGTVNTVMSGGGDTCGYSSASLKATATGASGANATPPGITFPHGLFAFTTSRCVVGSAQSFSITYPIVVPTSAKYYKFGPTAANPTPHWYDIPFTGAGSNTITFSIIDGGLGDDDLTANGSIVDDGGIGTIVVAAAEHALPVPTLSQWVLWLLAPLLVAALGGLRSTRRGRDARC